VRATRVATVVLTCVIIAGSVWAEHPLLAEKIRAGYCGVTAPDTHPQTLRDRGFNAVWMKMRYGDEYTGEEARWGKLCHDAGIAYFIIANTTSGYERALTGYRRAVDQTGTELEIACLRDPAFLNMVFRDRVTSALDAADAGGFKLAGFILDVETYGIRGHYNDDICYCDTCWADFLKAKGIEGGEEVGRGERMMWLTQHQQFVAYRQWQEDEWTGILAGIAADMRGRAPDLLLGNFHYFDNGFYRALAKGLGTADAPALICWESPTYEGGGLDVESLATYFGNLGAHVAHVPGHWVGRTPPDYAAAHCYQLAMATGGYWLFTSTTLEQDWQKTDPESPYYLPRPAEEYWAAYELTNREIVRSLADPQYKSELNVDLKGTLALPPVPANGAGLAESLAADGTLTPLAPESSAIHEGDVTQVRLAGIWLVRLAEGQKLSGTISCKQIGSYPTNLTWALLDPEGEQVASSLVALGEQGAIEVTAPADGVYSLYVQAGKNAFKVRLDAPHQVLREYLNGYLWVISETPPLYFYVPPETEEFTLFLKLDAAAENCNLKIVDPDGGVVVEEENARGAFEVQVPAEMRGKAWRMELSDPTEGVFEDVQVHLEGCPSYYAYSPEQLLVPGP
jgi:hypothetical protein